MGTTPALWAVSMTERNPLFPAYGSNRFDRLDGSQNIGGMGQNNQLGLRPNGPGNIIGIDETLTIERDQIIIDQPGFPADAGGDAKPNCVPAGRKPHGRRA